MKAKTYNINGAKITEIGKNKPWIPGWTDKPRSQKYLVETNGLNPDVEDIFKEICRMESRNYLMYGGVNYQEAIQKVFDVTYKQLPKTFVGKKMRELSNWWETQMAM
ncbi:MAG: hypothetical protein FWC51_04750 [Proteobacteria bacterium]|nr:hypothetical protein [Pseudomonadota bacterium]